MTLNQMIRVVLDIVYHGYVGNDTHPQLVAAFRGTLLAVIAGATAALACIEHGDAPTFVITTGVGTFLTTFAVRVLGEGQIDTWKNNRKKNGNGVEG